MIAQVRVIGIKLGARMFDDLVIGHTVAATAAPRREKIDLRSRSRFERLTDRGLEQKAPEVVTRRGGRLGMTTEAQVPGLLHIPISSEPPSTSTKAAAASSSAAITASPEPRPPAIRKASALANTASVAIAPVVNAVPSAIAKVAATPAAKSPCASAKTRTTMAPAQG